VAVHISSPGDLWTWIGFVAVHISSPGDLWTCVGTVSHGPGDKARVPRQIDDDFPMTSAATDRQAHPFDPTEPFTRAEGLKGGLTVRQLRGRDFVRLFRNVYISRSVTRTITVRAKAALLIAPDGAVISHHTAALVWRGTVPDNAAIHVTISHKQTLDVPGIRTHRYLRTPKGFQHTGVRVTSPERTFADLAEFLDLVQLVTLGDRLVRRKATTTARLMQFARNWDRPRYGLIRRAASLVRTGVDSPPESRLRMLVVLAGLPEPSVNLILRNCNTGDWERRFELAYEELLVAIEYEGRHHREEDEVWANDIERREDLDRRTWRVVQVISDGLYSHPLRTLQRIEQARLDRGARPTVGFREEWRRFFPGRDR